MDDERHIVWQCDDFDRSFAVDIDEIWKGRTRFLDPIMLIWLSKPTITGSVPSEMIFGNSHTPAMGSI